MLAKARMFESQVGMCPDVRFLDWVRKQRCMCGAGMPCACNSPRGYEVTEKLATPKIQ